MEWWQCFVGAGLFVCFCAIINTFRPIEALRFAQQLQHDKAGTIRDTAVGLAIGFVVGGALLGTPVWFFYWLFFD